MSDLVGIAGLVVGIVGTAYAVWSDVKRRGERQWAHMALANLKPSIQGQNTVATLKAIDNMMAFLHPPKASPARSYGWTLGIACCMALCIGVFLGYALRDSAMVIDRSIEIDDLKAQIHLLEGHSPQGKAQDTRR